MTLDEIIQYNNDKIRGKYQERSITPYDEADCLDEIAKFAASAYPFAVTVVGLEDGSARIQDSRMKDWDVYSIVAGGFFLFGGGVDFTKVVSAEFIDFPAGVLSVGSKVSVQLKGW